MREDWLLSYFWTYGALAMLAMLGLLMFCIREIPL